MIYLTSDLHLNHTRCLELLPNRPFKTLDEMNEKLINNYNRTIKYDDVVIILGDLLMGGNKQESIPKLLPQLHGHKILIRGNHEMAFGDARPGKQETAEKLYLDNGILKVYDGCVNLEQVLVDNQEPIPYDLSFIKLCHFNFLGIPDHIENRTEKLKYEELCVEDDNISWLLHGHRHSLIPMSRPRMYDVGVDANNFKPVSLNEIVSSIVNFGRSNERTSI